MLYLAEISNNHFYFIEKNNNNTLKGKVFVPFCILLRNEGNKKVGIFSENYSLGYFAWSIEIKEGNKIIKINKRKKIFYRNLPDWSTVFPSESLVIPFKILDWENVDFFKDKNIQIRVIFTQREDPESNRTFQNKPLRKFSDLVFKGRVRSQWYSLKIEHGNVVEIKPVNGKSE